MGRMRPGVLSMGAKPWDRGRRGWWVRVYAHGAEEAYRVGPPGARGEQQARAICAEIQARQARAGLWSGPASRPLPAAEMLRGWYEIHGPLRSARTRATDRARVERLARFLGAKDLRDLRAEDCHRFAAGVLEEGRSGDLAAGCLSILRRVLNLAVEANLVGANPVPGMGRIITQAAQRTRREVRRPDAWTREEAAEIQRLAARRGPRGLYLGISLALGTGARRGELLALRWEDIDLQRRRIHFRRAAACGGGTKTPKTGRDRKTPISEGLATLLAGELDRQRRAQLEGRPAPEWVVASPTGRFWSERNFSRAWERLRRRFGKTRPLPFHSTRHTFVTWALEAGRAPKLVAQWVGASTAVIHAHYEHALPDSDDSMEFAEPGSVSARRIPNQTVPGKVKGV